MLLLGDPLARGWKLLEVLARTLLLFGSPRHLVGEPDRLVAGLADAIAARLPVPFGLAVALLLLTNGPSWAQHETDANPAGETTNSTARDSDARDSTAPMESYWGILPEPSDSVTAQFKSPRPPLWESALLLPYQIVRLPFRAVAAGAGASFVYLDNHRVFSRVARLLGPRQGPFGFAINVTAGGLTGFGGGVTLLHDAFLGRENRAKLKFQITGDGGRRATAGFRLGHDQPIQSEIGLGYRLVPTARYFGLGPRSHREDKSLYSEELSWAAIGHSRRVAGTVALEAKAMVSGIGSRGSSSDEYPGVDERFAEELPDGYGHRSDAVSLLLALQHDTTREEGRPRRGGVRRASVARTDGIGADRASFWSLRGDLEQFVPLWNSRQTLALRSFLSWSEPIGGSRIPFQRLVTNDDPDLLRGYQDFRFRDRGMTALTAEYRWPIWAARKSDGVGLDAYLLGDLGQVFGNRQDLALDQLTVSYGGGVRFIGHSGFVGRLEMAWSEEEMKVRLRADQVFQFARGGLYHGRNPIPLR